MSKGVTFTSKSARRIADVVRRVEGTPRGELPGRPHRTRHGKWPPIYECTAVNTGAGTCTVKLVEDDSGTLNSASEATAYYDDDGPPPVVGERGSIHILSGTGLYFHPRWNYELVSGYSGATTQVLTHVSGTLTWKGTGTCS